jgi:hypothetical protein
MRTIVACVLIALAVSIDARRVHRSLAPLATEFLESPAKGEAKGDAVPLYMQQPLLMSSSPIVQTPMMTQTLMTDLNGDVQSVPVPSAGTTITLPPSPSFIPDPPEAVAESCSGDDCANLRARLSRSKIIALEARVAAKKAVVDAHDDWLADAKNAAERLNKQISEVEEQRGSAQEELDGLALQKADLEKTMKRDLLQDELERAQQNLRDVARQTDQLQSAHRAIDARAAKVQESMFGLGKQLNWDTKDVEQKLQEFNDANSALAAIGDDLNADQPENDITAAPTDEAEDEQAAEEEDEAEEAENNEDAKIAEGEEPAAEEEAEAEKEEKADEATA